MKPQKPPRTQPGPYHPSSAERLVERDREHKAKRVDTQPPPEC